jgi:hypothetical protein
MRHAPSAQARRRLDAAAMASLACAALLAVACDVEDPDRLTANQRFVPVTFDAATAVLPAGTVTIATAGDAITVDATGLPYLAAPAGGGEGWAYEGWILYPFADTTGYVSAGRFRIAAPGDDSEFPTGEARFTYGRDGAFTLTSAGTTLSQGQPMPDTLDFSEDVTFLLAIEPDPDPEPLAVGYSHLVVTKGVLTVDGVALIVPASPGTPQAGDFSTLEGEANVNAATGEYRLHLEQMPYFTRSSPPNDPGLIYQAWFVDDDGSGPHYQSIARFNPNAVGDANLTGALYPGDLDGDGVPEPLDVSRVLITIEPDMITAQQPAGQGVDTSGDLFQTVPYQETLPDVLP